VDLNEIRILGCRD